ncbi:HlyD family type I secretion periplasmic adaptor subunit [Burkholderia pyrrocinia]|uniref:HlyD family type I secretion periplasmic adaptor subunit n=1 Tax=Burkholderia pyrrocinia TaxID=60550 RepID=UPI00158A38C1|nr:HlyD family type I secretion periplasmic adaptor subunit [Burkholderia pyrrocinia]
MMSSLPGRDLLRRAERHLGAVSGDGTPRLFVLALATCLLAILIWSCFAPVARVVRGEGRVVPSAHSQIIQHLEGGIVSQILVHEGQLVKRDSVLLRIQDTQASAAQGEGEQKVAYLKARIARLQAEASGEALKIPKGLDENLPSVQSEIAAYQARQTQSSGQLAVMSQELAQKRGEIEEAQTKLQNLRGELAIARDQERVVAGLVAQNAGSTLESLDAQSRVQRLSSSISETEALLVRLRGAAGEAQARIGEYAAHHRSDASSELAASQLELEHTQQEMRSQSDRLARTEVRAPVDGVVNHVFVNTVGGVVRPGEQLIELTPVADNVLIEGRIRPSDRGEIRPGLPARIRFSAYDYAAEGTIAGAVDEVSADTIADERGERYYRLTVRVQRESQARMGKPIIPGMTATIDVVVGRRSVIQYVLSPVFHFYDSAFREAR